PASFEPTLDFCFVNIPRFNFEKFQETDSTLTTQMKSVGEVMAIGRTFKESLQKAVRSLEINSSGFEEKTTDCHEIREKLVIPNCGRLWFIADAFRNGFSIDYVYQITKIDTWFLDNIKEIIEAEDELRKAAKSGTPLGFSEMRKAKMLGFSDRRIGELLTLDEEAVRKHRKKINLAPVFKRVDTCAAEFEAHTPYLYSTYETECETAPTARKKVMILGGGPNRIGQGIEFDYCCVHGVMGLKEEGFETIMVNCNPETVSTDYDTSDRLYFEPLTFEDVMEIVEKEKPDGAIVQFGGQTPLKLAIALDAAGVKILGTSPFDIDRAEDRKQFKELLDTLKLKQTNNATVTSLEEGIATATRIGYPVVVRPSYVLGGRAMEIVFDEASLNHYMTYAVKASPDHPILIDKFLEGAIEVDVDAISDGEVVVVGGIMQHIEEAGVHSGDSACSLPPFSLSGDIVDEIRKQTKALAKGLNVLGLINIQFAVKETEIFVLEVNPRASRTVPFVSKAIGVPLAKIAARVMAGRTLKELGFVEEKVLPYFSVKEAVFPFIKFPGADTVLGPEMKSTGEVMGIATEFGKAFAKSQAGAGLDLPLKGKVFISVADKDKPGAAQLAKSLFDLGFKIVSTGKTASEIEGRGAEVERTVKLSEGRPNIVDYIKNGEISLIINTTVGKRAMEDSFHIRYNAIVYGIPYCTTIHGALAALEGIKALLVRKEESVRSLQEYYNES
ncbi:MAG: carbamoyl-phosphate synthase large subunit, partial [Nitrospinota bacterium]